VTTSDELREWALYDKWADTNNLTQNAWLELYSYRAYSFGFPCMGTGHLRTFALLVAEALENEA
jgi:hypothetical protein